jgi:replication factor C large subunit
VFDEIDSAFDRGEIPALTRILSDASGPVIVVANDAKAQKIAPLRKLCDQIEFKKISNGSVRDVLADIAKAEGASGAPVEKIADNAKGDVRGAINDLQAACQGGCGGFPLMSRDRAGDLSTALKTVFKATGFSEAVGAGDGLDMELDTLMLWILENIPAEYEDAEEVAEAMRWVSRSDVFAGRVYRRQDYGMLKYSRALGLAGVAMSKKKPYLKFVQYESHYPTAIRLFGFTKKSRGMRKAIASKIARATHTSTNEAIKAIPFIALLPGAADYFELTEEEKDALQELASGKA